MPNACAAYGCTMKSGTNLLSKVGFFTFPKEVTRRRLWQIAVRRANWTPTPSSRLCSVHFITGRPSKDKNHPDYVPSIFSHHLPKKTARKGFRPLPNQKPLQTTEDSDASDPDSPSKQDEGTMTQLTSGGIDKMMDTIEAQTQLMLHKRGEEDRAWVGPPGKARWVVFVRHSS